MYSSLRKMGSSVMEVHGDTMWYYFIGDDSLVHDNFMVLKQTEGGNTVVRRVEQLPVRIFPNPNNGVVQLELGEGVDSARLEVYDLAARLVHRGILRAGTNRLDLSSLPAGTYHFYLHQGNRRMQQAVVIE